MISYKDPQDNKNLLQQFSKMSEILLHTNFENDPELNSFISKLSDQYNKYKKGSFEFPRELKSVIKNIIEDLVIE